MTQETLLTTPFVLLIACVIGLIAASLLTLLIKKWGQSIHFLVYRLNLSPLCKPLHSVFPAVFTLSAFETLTYEAAWMSPAGHLIRVWTIASFGWLIVNTVSIATQAILKRYDVTTPDNLKARQVHTQIQVIHKIISIFILFITLALALMTFNSVKQIGISILASAGVFGIIIGFAAQKMLGNLLAGIHIALAQPIRLDDVVVVEGEWGRIEEITLTFVVVKIWDERRLVLPISYFIEKPFQNWTRTTSKILGIVFIYTDYQMPVQRIREKLTELLKKSPHWDQDVNNLQVTNSTDRAVEIRALMSASDSGKAWNLRCEIREALIAFMQNEFPEHLPKTRIELKELKKAGAEQN